MSSQDWNGQFFLPNVKEHAPLSAGAGVDHGVGVETTGEHENRAADRGCCVSSCSLLLSDCRWVVEFGWIILNLVLVKNFSFNVDKMLGVCQKRFVNRIAVEIVWDTVPR